MTTKKTISFFLLLFIYSLEAFYDLNLEKLWDSIPDINHPTFDDYKRIELYLHTQRPYLEVLSADSRYNRILNFKLLGPNHEMPTFEKYSFNVREETSKRCILLFGSFNGIYYDKVYLVLKELKDCGYSGHVLVRIGGFPNTENGGLKICHVPYAFKVAFLQEAKNLGYKEVLWIDSAMHPLTNLETIFQKIKENGSFFLSAGTLHDMNPLPRLEASKALGITPEVYPSIPHLPAGILGFNMEDPLTLRLLEYWHQATEQVIPCISWYPEELSLSILAWSLGCKPIGQFWEYWCEENYVKQVIQNRPLLQFYLDIRR